MKIPSIGPGIEIDITRLLETRLLLQAASGGGKSYALRRIIEQCAGRVQIIVIDREGEFASLREKHDFIIAAAKDGDALAHPKTAALLARKLLETGVSAVLDIYELKKHEQIHFVKLFLDSMVAAPKSLWHPVLVILDEAHLFAPEKGSAESLQSVIDMATLGRKRGFGLIAATQRIAKFNKDAAADLLNKMVGLTGLDIDVKRAADDLGFTTKEAMQSLKNLDAGEFYIVGPAFSKEVVKFRTGPVHTTHPKPGSRQILVPPKPTAAILKVLPQLADLPKEAEQQIKTMEDLRKENAQLKRELSSKAPAAPDTRTIDLAFARGREEGMKAGYQTGALHSITQIEGAIKDLGEKIVKKLPPLPAVTAIRPPMPVQTKPRPRATLTVSEPFGSAPVKGEGYIVIDDPHGDRDALPAAQRKILDALAWLADKGISAPDRKMLSAICGYSGGHYGNTISAMRTANLLEKTNDGTVQLTAQGSALAIMKDDDRPIHEQWMDGMPAAERKIFQSLVDAYPEPLSREQITEVTGYSGGHFGNTLGAMRTKGAIDYPSKGMVCLTKWAMPQ